MFLGELITVSVTYEWLPDPGQSSILNAGAPIINLADPALLYNNFPAFQWSSASGQGSVFPEGWLYFDRTVVSVDIIPADAVPSNPPIAYVPPYGPSGFAYFPTVYLAYTYDGSAPAGTNEYQAGEPPPPPNSLFTTGADTVNFNALTSDQQQAIANGADTTHGLGGNDFVTLPNSGTATFSTGSTVADNSYRIFGGSGTYNIFEGAGTEFITISGNGSSNITAGSGADTISINGTGTNNVLAGSGNEVLSILGGGSLKVTGTFVGSASIGASSTLELNGSASGGPISFAGPGGTLRVNGNTMPINTIKGFAVGDTIDLRGVSFAPNGGAFFDGSGNNVLNVFENGTTFDLTLDPNQDFYGLAFVLSSDGKGGTNISLRQGLSFTNSFGNVDTRYETCIVAAENDLQSHWSNPVTINLAFDAQAQGTNAAFLATNNWPSSVNFSYTELRDSLTAHKSPAAAFLPDIDPTGGHTFSLPKAYARMLDGNQPDTTLDDTVILNTSYNWSFGQDVIGIIEHEITEGGMGRVGGLGDQNSAWSTMDLFRYNSAHQFDKEDGRDGQTTFFSIDGGSTLSSLSFNNEYGSRINDGDTADFTQSDVFGVSDPGQSLVLSQTDLAVMAALGWTPYSAPPSPTPSPNPPTPAGTTANMIMRDGSSGGYEIYNIGNNSILAGYGLGRVGLDWQFVGLGGFNGTDTSDMILRNSSTGAFEFYDISNNNITNAALLGTVGLDWKFGGFGDFSSRPGETDMILRNSATAALEVYDISNNSLISAYSMGAVGLDWRIAGFGDFSSNPNETDMIMRNANTGALEVYDIANNALISAYSMGAVGLDWQVAGFGNFSSRGNETDMIMRNSNTGALEVYNIANNSLMSAFSMGAVGLDWQVVGFGHFSGNANETDMMMRNTNTGALEIYNIANNALTAAYSAGAVGLNWEVGGIAPDALNGASSGSSDINQLVQAMAGFGSGSGAADSLNAVPLSADTSQQPLLTTPQHA
jgi:hypothetical protein